MSAPTETRTVVVIGAGVGGIGFGVAVTRKWGENFDFVILEKASSVGGTWRDNSYPGCSCDISAQFYSLSTDLNPDFTISHPFNPELLDYWKGLVKKHKLAKNIYFNQEVQSVSWDPKSTRYDILVSDTSNGAKKVISASFVVSAIGILQVPKYPDIPNKGFQGPMFHSAKWNHSVSLSSKRVGVVGNGCSGAQIVPAITVNESTKVVQFIRTPNWYFPNPRFAFTDTHRWIMRNVPFALQLYRFLIFIFLEIFYVLHFTTSFLRKLSRSQAEAYIKKKAPQELVSSLTPNYVMGCKRIVIDPGYLEALHRPNISLTFEGIAEFVEGGARLNSGEIIPLDVIVLATGFVVDRFPLSVVGRTGQSLQEYFDDQGGMTAYRGTTVPTFPNFFILAGPATATGHTSVIFTEEVQTEYILQCIQHLLPEIQAGARVALEPKQQACDTFNKWIEERLKGSVFYSCSHSWYRVGGKGRVTSIWPASATWFWWTMRNVIWNDFWMLKGGSEGAAELRIMTGA